MVYNTHNDSIQLYPTQSGDDGGFDLDYESCVGDNGNDDNSEEQSESAQIQNALDYFEKVSLDDLIRRMRLTTLPTLPHPFLFKRRWPYVCL